MKKLVAVLLAGMMCVSLAACGGKKEEAADTTAAETTDEAAAEDTEEAAEPEQFDVIGSTDNKPEQL